ncbi:MAG: arsinothricin resistance N-acetyltransferase ArsN1 family B [Gammaproteobacteria bacterium]
MSIREVRAADAPRIATIYNHYVRETVVTFEEEAVADAEMARRIAETAGAYPWLVWEDGDEVEAYAHASSWKRRSAYRHSAECTIYVAPARTGRGIGRALYPALVAAMRGRGLHAAIGGISLPNPASITLHEKMGFAPIGRFRQVGFKFGLWVDVGYWELILA